MRKTLTAFFWLLAASCALAQGLPGLAILPGMFGGGPTLVGTWNPSDKDTDATLSNGNLTMTRVSSSHTGVGVRSTNSVTSGQWYFEVRVGSAGTQVGVGTSAASLVSSLGNGGGASIAYVSGNRIFYNNTFVTGPGTFATNDVVGVKLDFNASQVSFNLNGGSFVTGGGFPSGTLFMIASASANGDSATLNKSIVYPVPSGFKVWGNP